MICVEKEEPRIETAGPPRWRDGPEHELKCCGIREIAHRREGLPTGRHRSVPGAPPPEDLARLLEKLANAGGGKRLPVMRNR